MAQQDTKETITSNGMGTNSQSHVAVVSVGSMMAPPVHRWFQLRSSQSPACQRPLPSAPDMPAMHHRIGFTLTEWQQPILLI